MKINAFILRNNHEIWKHDADDIVLVTDSDEKLKNNHREDS